MDELIRGLQGEESMPQEGGTMSQQQGSGTVVEPTVQPARYAPEPRNAWHPQDYEQRVICWPQPALGTPEGEQSFDELLALLAEHDPGKAAELDWLRWDSAVKADRDRQTFEAQVEAHLAQRNRWIASQNEVLEQEIAELRAAVELAEATNAATVDEEETARAVITAAQAQRDAAHRLAAERCSRIGRAYNPLRPDPEVVRAPDAAITELAVPAHPERRTSVWKHLSTIVSGAVLGFAIGHLASLLPNDLGDFRTVWWRLLLAGVLGSAIYLVLGSGLSEATRRVYRGHLEPCDPQPWRPSRRLLWGSTLALVALPLVANVAMEAHGLRAAQDTRLAEQPAGASLAESDVPVGEQRLAWAVFLLIGSLMVTSNLLVVVSTTLNEEDEAVLAALGRRRAAAAQAARLAEPAVQEALQAVADVQCELLRVADAETALAALQARRRAPVAALEARLAAARERWQEPLWEPDAATRPLLDNVRDAASGAAGELRREVADAVARLAGRPARAAASPRPVATRRARPAVRWGRRLAVLAGAAALLGASVWLLAQ